MKRKRITRVPCPRCRKPTDLYDNPFKPFCSERCRILDLGAWAGEEYRIAGEPADKGKIEEEEERKTKADEATETEENGDE